MKTRERSGAFGKVVSCAAAVALAFSMMPATAIAYAAESSPVQFAAASLSGSSLGMSDGEGFDTDVPSADDVSYALVYTQDEQSTSITGYLRFAPDASEGVQTGDALSAFAGSDGISVQSDDDTADGEEYVFKWDSANKPNPNVVIPDTINGKPVTSIANEAFEDANWIESVTLPESLERIGDEAFRGCSSMASVNLPKSLKEIGYYAFGECSALKSVTVPSGCFLGSGVFSSCSALASVTLEEGVTCSRFDWGYEYVSEGIFYSCGSLASISLPASIDKIGDRMFEYCYKLESIVLSEGVTSIGSYAFYGCRPASTVKLPASLTEFGEKSLYWYSDYYYDDDGERTGQSSYNIQPASWQQYYKLQQNSNYINVDNTTVLQPSGAAGTDAQFTTEKNDNGVTITGVSDGYPANLVIPSKLVVDGIEKDVTAIGDNAFKDATWMETVVIPSSITSIGYSAFEYCVSLTSVDVPQGCFLGSDAFANCEKLATVLLGENITCSTRHYYNNSYNDDEYSYQDSPSYGVFRDCDALTRVSIPGSIGTVGSSMFRDCDNLQEVTIGEGTTAINDGAFCGCNKLATVTLPSTLTTVDSSAFERCSVLESIALPDTVTSIGSRAFSQCWRLSTFDLPASLRSLGSYAFEYCKPSVQVALPASLEAGSIGEQALSFESDDYGYWDNAKGEWVDVISSYSIAASTWGQYWALQGNKRYIDPRSTTVVAPSSAQGAFSLKTTDNSDGTVTVVGVQDGTCESLDIAAALPGKTVSAIGENAFEDATWLKSLTMPDTVKSIGREAFRGCVNLESITVPDDCWLGGYAFADCYAATTLNLGENLTYLKSYEYDPYYGYGYDSDYDYDYYEINYENGTCHLTSRNVFYNCDALVSVSIPGSMGAVGSSMFEGCDNLQTVVVGEGVTAIKQSAFRYCYKLESVTLPSTLTSIEGSAFIYCHKLASFILPSKLESLGDRAFCECEPTEAVVLPASLPPSAIGERSLWFDDEWDDGYWDDDDNWVNNRNQYVIKTATWAQYWKLTLSSRYINTNNTTVMPPSANTNEVIVFKFSLNEDGTVVITGAEVKAANLTIPSYIDDSGKAVSTPVSSASTQSMSAQADATPHKVVTIGKDAFKDDQVLESVSLPDTLQSVAEGAFAGCPALQQVLVLSDDTTFAEDSFTGAGGESGVELVCDENSQAARFAEQTEGVSRASAASLGLFATAVPSKESVTYSPTGTERPQIAVSVDNVPLTENEHYTLTYPEQDAAGPAVVTIEAIEGSGYSGEAWCSYQVNQADLAQASISAIPDQNFSDWDEDEATPKPVITFQGVTLNEGSDYTLNYANNYDYGTATVTAKGRNNYMGQVSTTFNIVGKQSTGNEPASQGGVVDKPQATQSGAKTGASQPTQPGVATNTLQATQPVNSTGTSQASSVASTTAPSKAANPMKVKASKKTLKASALQAKSKQVKLLKVSKAKGKVTYKKAWKGKKLKNFKINKKTGKITVPKNTKAGTYKLKVKVKAAGNGSYLPVTKTVTVKIRVL